MFSLFPQSSSIIKKSSIQKFIKTYAQDDNWHNLNLHTGDLGYGLVHYALIRNLKPKRIMCVGSRYGFIPAICALACKDNQQGIVDFVDAGFDQNSDDPNHWGGVGMWKKITKDKYFKPFGIASYLNLYVTTTEQFAEKYPNRKYQYIHLDGDHSYSGVKFDFDMLWPRISSGDFLCLHDIYTKDLGGLHYGVEKFWKQLKEKHRNCFEYQGLCGLGIIQK